MANRQQTVEQTILDMLPSKILIAFFFNDGWEVPANPVLFFSIYELTFLAALVKDNFVYHENDTIKVHYIA